MKNKEQNKNIVVLAHHLIKGAFSEAEKVGEYLQSCGCHVTVGTLNDPKLLDIIAQEKPDLVITLGGDGTVLRAGHLCAPLDIPIFAINMGKFGFLIEVGMESWREHLDRWLNGEYWTEERMMLHATLWRENKSLGDWDVLNETVIGRGASVRPVQLRASLDGKAVTTYVADALIVATPTGSTAYALAAGGPILPPELRNILLIPVAPHLSIDRAIVLAQGSTVRVDVCSDHDVVLSVDGQNPVHLKENDWIEVVASQHLVRFVRFQEVGYFYQNLIKLMDQNPAVGKTNDR